MKQSKSNQKVRIQKLISAAGLYSRREAERIIKLGKVKVNHNIAKLGDKASWEDRIEVNQKILQAPESKVYYLFNKPDKILTSLKKQDDRKIVTDFLPQQPYVFPVGRLDYHTTGTLILTNDGELTYRLTHPKYEVIRVYQVELNKLLTLEQLSFLNSNKVMIDNQHSWQIVKKIKDTTYQVTLKQGLNHHVKKLFNLVHLHVRKLERIMFANLSHVADLKPGAYRFLTKKEIQELKHLVKL